MEADTIAFLGLSVTTIGAAVTGYFKTKHSLDVINATVKHQGEQIGRLKKVNSELKKENKSLMARYEATKESYDKQLKELHDKLYEALKGKKNGGVF